MFMILVHLQRKGDTGDSLRPNVVLNSLESKNKWYSEINLEKGSSSECRNIQRNFTSDKSEAASTQSN